MSTIRLEDASVPDSELARRATRHVAALSPPALYHHCVRTFLLGDAVGQQQGLKYDRELLYLAAVMHDLGFVDAVGGTERFEVTGADAARAFALEHGLSDDKADVLWDAVALHTSVGISARKRPEIALVTVGTAMDIGGFGAEQLDPEVVEKILADWPRLGWDRVLPKLISAELRRKGPRPYVFTWLAEAGREIVPGWRCPTVLNILRACPFNEPVSRNASGSTDGVTPTGG